ncbi:MAG: hypothetical protein ACTHM1_03725 [Solirubrobacteraceae bacterium]
MPDLLASITTAEVISLVIPLGLLLATMAWLGWQIHGRRSRS